MQNRIALRASKTTETLAIGNDIAATISYDLLTRFKEGVTFSMLDFHIQKSTRQCHTLERKFVAGEVFYSVLIAAGAEVIRQDYCQDAWNGAPENVIGWWKSRMPDENGLEINLAPNEVMVHYFEQLHAARESEDMAYVLSLLMVRKRIMRLNGSEQNDQGHELMILSNPKTEKEYKVPVMRPTVDQVEKLQQQLAELLYKDAA